MLENAQALSERIHILEPRLRRLASTFSTDPMDADDIFSEIVEAILTKCAPSYSDAMIFTKAKWVAMTHRNTEIIYSKYVGDEDDLPGNPSRVDDDEQREIDFVEIDLANNSPEQALVEKENAAEFAFAVSQLTPTLQMIVSLLRNGYRPVDVANKLGMSRSAVTQNIQKISRTMLAAGIS